MTADDQEMTAMTAATVFDDDDDGKEYKWSEIRDRLALTSNVANARWMPEKLLPALDGLNAPKLLTSKGRPTKFGAQMLARYKLSCVDNSGDYETFCRLVKKSFGDGSSDAVKSVPVEVLGFGDENGDSGDRALSPFSTQQQTIDDREDDLTGKLARAMDSKRKADGAIAKLEGLNAKSWEQQVIEDEIAKFQLEQEQKEKEASLRLQVRQMLEGNGSDAGQS